MTQVPYETYRTWIKQGILSDKQGLQYFGRLIRVRLDLFEKNFLERRIWRPDTAVAPSSSRLNLEGALANQWLKRIAVGLGLDRSTVAYVDPVSGRGSFTYGWARDPSLVISQPLDVNELFPWAVSKAVAGEMMVIPSLGDFPEEGRVDRESFERFHGQSGVLMPLQVGGETVGTIGFGTIDRRRKFPPKLVKELRFIGEILAYALANRNKLREEE